MSNNNEALYRNAVKAAQQEAEQNLAKTLANHLKGQLAIKVNINIRNVPTSNMPKGSRIISDNEERYMYYLDTINGFSLTSKPI